MPKINQTDAAMSLIQWLDERGHYALASYGLPTGAPFASTCHLQVTFVMPPSVELGSDAFTAATGEWADLLAEIERRELRVTDVLSLQVRGEVRHFVGLEDRVLWEASAKVTLVL